MKILVKMVKNAKRLTNNSLRLIKVRMVKEMKELNKLLYRSPDAAPATSKRLKVIKDLVQYRSHTTPTYYCVVEYDIEL